MDNSSDVYGDQYPIIWYQPEVDFTYKSSIKENQTLHIISGFPEAVEFAKSLGISFLLIVPNDFNEDLLVENFNKNLYGRRFCEIEARTIFEQISHKLEAKESFKGHVFFTHEDFESEVFVEKDLMDWYDYQRDWNVEEFAKVFREEFIFWERKQRGLERQDAVFVRSGEGFGMRVHLRCQSLCIKKLKELANKRNHEKKKLIYYVNSAECCYDWNDFATALEFTTKALGMMKHMYGEEHPNIPSLHKRLAMIYYKKKNYEQAIEHGLKVIKARKPFAEEIHSNAASFFYALAHCFFKVENHERSGEFCEAIDYYLEVIEMRESVFGETCKKTTSIYQSLGWIFLKFQQNEKAIEHYLKAIEIEESGEKDSSLLKDLYLCVGDGYFGLKDFSKAFEYHMKSGQMSNFDENSALFWRQLAITYSNSEQYEKARSFYYKALWQYKRLESNEDVASMYFEMGRCSKALKNYFRAQLDYRDCFEAQMKLLETSISLKGAQHPETLILHDNFAKTLAVLEEDEGNLACHLKALHLNISIKGEAHPATLNSHRWLANVYYYHMSQYEKSMEHELKVLEISKFLYGEQHEEVYESYRQLGYLYSFLDQDEKAVQHFAKALEIVNFINGELNEDLIDLYRDTASTYYTLRENKKGLEYLLKLLELHKRAYGKISYKTANLYHEIGDYLPERGSQRAKKYLSRAVIIYKSLLRKDPSNSDLVSALRKVTGSLTSCEKLAQQNICGDEAVI